jgi:hypothetical protein
MKVIRLLFLLTLFLQTSTLSFALNSTIPFLQAESSKPLSAPSSLGGSKKVFCPDHQSDGIENLCGLADAEDTDSDLEEGLQGAMQFDLTYSGRGPLLLLSERWYNFFRQYNIPPPEFA